MASDVNTFALLYCFQSRFMNSLKLTLREEVRELAVKAFEQHLISGYGDGEYGDKYQLVLRGKPQHFRLERARQILLELLDRAYIARLLDSLKA